MLFLVCYCPQRWTSVISAGQQMVQRRCEVLLRGCRGGSCSDITQGDCSSCGGGVHHVDYRDNPFIIPRCVPCVCSDLCRDVIVLLLPLQLLPKRRPRSSYLRRHLINRQNYRSLPDGQYCCVVMEKLGHTDRLLSQSNPH